MNIEYFTHEVFKVKEFLMNAMKVMTKSTIITVKPLTIKTYQ